MKEVEKTKELRNSIVFAVIFILCLVLYFTEDKLIYTINQQTAYKYLEIILILASMYSLGMFILYFSIYVYMSFQNKAKKKTMQELAYVDKLSGISNMNKFKKEFIPFRESKKEKI